MKNLKKSILASSLVISLFCVSCGKERAQGKDSGSDTQTTANDSSGTESKADIGVASDNQKDVPGYPSNQSNLNSDSTSKLHDVDTTSKKAVKDKPNKHQ